MAQISVEQAVAGFLTPQPYPRPEAEEAVWKQGEIAPLPSGRQLRSYGRGPVVFFAHGWESRGSTFSAWVSPFVQAGFRVLLWDGPAHGDSPGKQTHMPAFTLAWTEDLKSLDITPHAVIGHSFGGSSAVLSQVLGLLPVTKIITIGSPSNIENVFRRAQDLLGFDDALFAEFRRQVHDIVQFDIHRADFRKEGFRVTASALVIHDREDKEVPFQEGIELNQGLAFAKFLATEKLGHRRILRSDEVIQAALEFVK